ncbi:MAG: hypothetical protein AMS17_02795 [Spirochaetes bacterium DG_61]|nr:MAG: hypothetical protein AMS17_02795 [Spirochaetes bacterium DG_61]
MSKKKLVLISSTALLLLIGVAFFFYMIMEEQFGGDASHPSSDLLLPLMVLAVFPGVLLLSSFYSRYSKRNHHLVRILRPLALFGMLMLIPRGNMLYRSHLFQNSFLSFALYNFIEYAIWRFVTTIMKETHDHPQTPDRSANRTNIRTV